jgi:hypothetical protein
VFSPLAGDALFFLLDQKEPKNQVSREASLPHMAFALQIRQNLGLQTIALLRSLKQPLLQIFAMPFPAHKARRVLPGFIRSCSVDR